MNRRTTRQYLVIREPVAGIIHLLLGKSCLGSVLSAWDYRGEAVLVSLECTAE